MIDSKPMKSIKLDFLPIGSPEINFVLGPPAMDIHQKLACRKSKQLEPSKSIFQRHTEVPQDEKITIKHIQSGGPVITVTKKRVKRILKRRKQRVAFLLENPEFSLPYKFRTKGPKHESRSQSAKNRRRKIDGRFAKVGAVPIDFTVSINDPNFDKENNASDQQEIVLSRNNL